MKTKLLAGIGALALLAAGVGLMSKPLMAQVRAALVQNRDEKGRSPWGQRMTCSNASNPSSSCQVVLATVPAGKRLVIEQIGGLMAADPTVKAITILLRSQGSSGAEPDISFAPMTLWLSNANLRQFTTNTPVLAYFEAGSTPVLEFRSYVDVLSMGGVVNGDGTAAGYLVDLQ